MYSEPYMPILISLSLLCARVSWGACTKCRVRHTYLHFVVILPCKCSRWGGWCFIIAFVPLIILYVVWIPATLMGKIQPHTGNSQEVQSVDMNAFDNGSMQTLSGVHIDDLPRKSARSAKESMGYNLEDTLVPTSISIVNDDDDDSVRNASSTR